MPRTGHGRGRPSPYADLLRQIKAELDLPVRCLMRPRANFLYTRTSSSSLPPDRDAAQCRGGWLRHRRTDAEGALDLPAMRTLLDACGGAPVTLHRCIDVFPRSVRHLPRCGGTRHRHGAASRGAGSAARAFPSWPRCCACGTSWTAEVLIGAGVNAAVMNELRAALPGARAFHASCKTLLESGMTFRREGVRGPARVGRNGISSRPTPTPCALPRPP